MELKASLKYTRVSSQRARLAADMVRGKDINTALALLAFSKKKSSALIYSLLQSALANATAKKVVDVDNLYVKTIYVNQGPHLKRFRPAARGQAMRRKKKQSHVHLVLDER